MTRMTITDYGIAEKSEMTEAEAAVNFDPTLMNARHRHDTKTVTGIISNLINGANLSAILVTLCLSMSVVTNANAVVINDDISVGRDELRAKCKRSGGTFKEKRNGRYLCVVKYDDSTTVVSCQRRKCNGVIGERGIRKPEAQILETIVAPNNVLRRTR